MKDNAGRRQSQKPPEAVNDSPKSVAATDIPRPEEPAAEKTGAAPGLSSPEGSTARCGESVRRMMLVMCAIIVSVPVMVFVARQTLAERAAAYTLAQYDREGLSILAGASTYAAIFGEKYRMKIAAGLYEREAKKATSRDEDCSGAQERIVSIGEHAVRFDPGQGARWGQLLLRRMDGCPPGKDWHERFVPQVLAWSPGLRPQLVGLTFQHLTKSIRQNDVESADALASQAIDLEPRQRGRVAAAFWDVLSERMRKPTLLRQHGKENFMKLACSFAKLEVCPENADDAALLCLSGLTNYFSGNVERAAGSFRELRDNHGGSPFSVWSRELLSLPIGTRECRTEPIRVKDRRHRAVAIRLLQVRISEKEITLTLGFRAGEEEARVPYAYGHWKSRYVLVQSGEPVYIVDDFGKKFHCLGHFQGGRQYAHSIDEVVGLGHVENTAVLYISPHEEATVSMSFPTVSEGASKISLVSPKVPGLNDDWAITDIPLRADFS